MNIHDNGILAQLGEHLPYKQRVTGSSPVGPIYAGVAELADAQDLKSCGTYTPVPVRFRSAAVGKSERNVEFTAFLLFFCFKKLMKLDLIDSVAMEEVAGFLDKLLSKDKYEGRREANMKYVVE